MLGLGEGLWPTVWRSVEVPDPTCPSKPSAFSQLMETMTLRFLTLLGGKHAMKGDKFSKSSPFWNQAGLSLGKILVSNKPGKLERIERLVKSNVHLSNMFCKPLPVCSSMRLGTFWEPFFGRLLGCALRWLRDIIHSSSEN